MKKQTDVEKLREQRKYDTVWLKKYKQLVDGLRVITELQFEVCNTDIEEWGTVYNGLEVLSKMMEDDIKDREKQETGE